MAKSSSTSPLRILLDAWTFFRKQPALWDVLLWLLILPVAILDVLNIYWPVTDADSIRQIGQAGYIFATILFTAVTFWGFASVLLVGRRMVVNRAGRSRTSFRAVRRESASLILPLFFTSLLRSIITLEWSLLAIIPASIFLLGSQVCRASMSPMLYGIAQYTNAGLLNALPPAIAQFLSQCSPVLVAVPLLLIPAFIYQLRSAFYGVAVASENVRYRDALRRSRAVVRGHSWRTLWVLCALGVLLFVPASIISLAEGALQNALLPQFPVISDIVQDAVYAVAGLLFTLGMVAFYGKLSKEAGRVEEIIPELE